MKAAIRICFVIPYMHAGGMERVMSLLIDWFNKNGDRELHLLIYGPEKEIFYPLPEGLPVHRPAFGFNHQRSFLSGWHTLRYLRGKIRDLQPAVVLSFGEYWNSFVLLALLGMKIPVVVSDRGRPDKHLGRGHEILRRILYPRAAAVIAQTSMARDRYRRHFRHQNVHVIGNPISCPGESPDPSEGEKTVLTVGRLIRTKHHDLLIRMFLDTAPSDWKLVIVGDDALRQEIRKELEQQILSEGAGERVVLAGARTDMESYYRNSRIFAFTSSSEGFPNVIGEAQAHGLPVVAFDCVAGPSEMVEDGYNGFLVPFGNIPLFKQRLKELLEDDELRRRMGERARQSIRAYSPDRIGIQYAELFESITD